MEFLEGREFRKLLFILNLCGKERREKNFCLRGFYKKANSMHGPNLASPLGTEIWSLGTLAVKIFEVVSVLSKVTLGARSWLAVRQAST